MGKDSIKKRIILWYTAVACLAICLYAAIFLSPLNITLHTSSLRPYCYSIPIVIICMVLIPSLFKGTRQKKDLCCFAFMSVVCLAIAPVFLHIAMFLDDGLSEYVISRFLFISALVLVYISPLPALVSIFRILFKKTRLAGLWFSVAVISFVAFEMIAPKIIKFYIRTHPSPAKVCRNNLHSLNLAMKIYASEFDGKLPTSSKWCDLLKPYVRDKPFLCPVDKLGPCDYAMNPFALSVDDESDDTVLFFESKPGWNQVGGPELFNADNHGGRGGYVLFSNRRLRFVTTEEISELKWKPNSDVNKKAAPH